MVHRRNTLKSMTVILDILTKGQWRDSADHNGRTKHMKLAPGDTKAIRDCSRLLRLCGRKCPASAPPAETSQRELL